jgi:hypothetical protein
MQRSESCGTVVRKTTVYVTSAIVPPNVSEGWISASLLSESKCGGSDASRARTVTGADERAVRSMIETSNGYSYPPLAAGEAVRRFLAGGYRPGFQTPVTVFGPTFAQGIVDTTLTDL